MSRIPFNRPWLAGNEADYLAQALANRRWSGDGPFTRRATEALQELLGAPRALLTTSCTHALEMAALLCDLGPGDEVILPSFTFVSTVNCFVLRGARPRFGDIRPDTLNLDERNLEALVTPATRAIAVVHYAGIGCNMEPILEIAGERGLAVVEDAAHGIGGGWRGRPLGTIGDCGAFSFHETKNITCGEGGALAIRREEWLARAEIVREKGTDRSRFFRGEVDRYRWVDVGSSYLPAELLAAFLLAQLEAFGRIQAQRRALWEGYQERLAGLAGAGRVVLPVIPGDCQPAYHLFHLQVATEQLRDRVIREMKAEGILATSHYEPLHLSPVGRRFGYGPGDLPVSEAVAARLLRLPLYFELTPGEQDEVVESLTRALSRAGG